MERGGNAVDAAIAALFCDGVSMPHSMGLGGGFLLTVYNKSTGEAWSLNSREVAPGAATADMFKENPKLIQTGTQYKKFILVSNKIMYNDHFREKLSKIKMLTKLLS